MTGAEGLPAPGDAWVFEQCPDGVVVADAEGVVVVFTRAAARVTGLRPEAVLGRPLVDALPLEDPDGRSWWTCVQPYRGLRTRTGHPERLLLLPGGREVLVAARYVRGARDGPVERVVVSMRDTHARAREEQSRAELISTVAHELRSPLTSVKGFTATLLAKWDRFNDEQKRLMLETVEADADRVTRLIAELLDIARIDSGRLGVRRQLVDMAAAVRRQVDGFDARGHEGATFVLDLADQLPELWADADRIDQVLANLLENAVRHGGGRVTVQVRAVEGPGAQHDGEPAGWTEVTVTDEGEGIPEEQVARVFTKWWRSGKRGGTGLGLYIVRGLVEAHGGSVSLGRGPGGGALFRFVLPPGTPELPR